jgi:CheY-like chemotaxis protein
MPVLDGLSAARQIRHAEENTGRHVPIIALTAHAIKGDEERFLAAGMDAYLSKPFNIEALFDVIGQAQSDPRGAQVAHFRGAAESNHEGENLVT